MPLQSKPSPIIEEHAKRNYSMKPGEKKLYKAMKTLIKHQKKTEKRKYQDISGQIPPNDTRKRARDQRIRDMKDPVPFTIPDDGQDVRVTVFGHPTERSGEIRSDLKLVLGTTDFGHPQPVRPPWSYPQLSGDYKDVYIPDRNPALSKLPTSSLDTVTLVDEHVVRVSAKLTEKGSGRMFVPAEFSFKNLRTHHRYEFKESFLLDSGADKNFIDTEYAKEKNLELMALGHPLKLDLADGEAPISGGITHVTKPILMRLGTHAELIQFYVTTLKSKMIVGHEWLQTHNPEIGWRDYSIQFNDKYCLKNCCRFKTLVYGYGEDEEIAHLNSIKSKKKPIDVREITADVFVELAKKGAQLGVSYLRMKNSTTNEVEIASLRQIQSQVYPFMDSLPINPDPPSLNDPYCKAFPQVFKEELADKLPEHRPWDCKIETLPGKDLPHAKIYNLTDEENESMRKYVEKELDKGFIRRSESPAGAPCFFVKKKDGSLRMCVDYRALNNITIKNKFPLPLISDLVRTLSKAKIYTALDLKGAFNLIRVREEDVWKTAFSTRFGHYETLVMPFGLTNAPSVLQQMLNTLFKDYIGKFVLIYLDDIIIFSEDEKDHDNHVHKVLTILEREKLYCRLKKSQFRTKRIEYLGYVITPNGVSMNSEKIKAVLDWKAPTNIKEIQMFLGFCNFYRKFIDGYAETTSSLSRLLKKDVPFKWTKEQEDAFEEIKQKYIKAPILLHPDNTKPFLVYTDASDFAVGCVLKQFDENKEARPIAFYSRQMTPPETNYEVYDKELLAIFVAFKEWRHFLMGRFKTSVFCDHKNLVWFTSTKILTRRQARWSLFLSDFDFEIKYIPGKANIEADALSRNPAYDCKDLPEFENRIKLLTSKNFPKELLKLSELSLKEFTLDCSLTTISDKYLESRLRDATSSLGKEELDKLIRSGPYVVENGILMYEGLICILNNDLKKEIMTMRHSTPMSGHFGYDKTLELILRDFVWTGMKSDVKKFVVACDCQRNKDFRNKNKGLLQQPRIPPGRFTDITVDFKFGLPKDGDYDGMGVIVCRLTKRAVFFACNEHITADKFASLFIREWVKHFGLPERMISDRDRIFKGNFWNSICAKLKVDNRMSSGYHPQTDGQSERVIHILEQYLRNYISHQQNDWVEFLPLAEFAYNNTYQSSINTTPFFASNGLNPRFDSVAHQQRSQSANELADSINKELILLKLILKESMDKYKRFADDKRKDVEFKVGDFVWLSAEDYRTERPNKKLDSKRLGPFKVSKQFGKVAYQLNLPHTMKIHNVFHVSKLSKFIENEFNMNRKHRGKDPIILEEDNMDYEVDEILDIKMLRNKWHYLLRFTGYDKSHDEWIPRDQMNCPRLVRKFHDKYPGKPCPLDEVVLHSVVRFREASPREGILSTTTNESNVVSSFTTLPRVLSHDMNNDHNVNNAHMIVGEDSNYRVPQSDDWLNRSRALDNGYYDCFECDCRECESG